MHRSVRRHAVLISTVSGREGPGKFIRRASKVKRGSTGETETADRMICRWQRLKTLHRPQVFISIGQGPAAVRPVISGLNFTHTAAAEGQVRGLQAVK